jgi:hypothetical protein
MPITDPADRKNYHRLYMQRRRAAARGQPVEDETTELRRRVRELEAELTVERRFHAIDMAELKRRVAELEGESEFERDD